MNYESVVNRLKKDYAVAVVRQFLAVRQLILDFCFLL